MSRRAVPSSGTLCKAVMKPLEQVWRSFLVAFPTLLIPWGSLKEPWAQAHVPLENHLRKKDMAVNEQGPSAAKPLGNVTLQQEMLQAV